ncbi:MAG: YebC/PmpR family DNA-binding transcriptional regulator [Patescibacteria group bacterium]
MSGHNKWTQIKRQKAVVDGKKSKTFSLLARNITMEAKKVNGDKNSANLRAIIEKARAANMPSENIDRAIAKASGAGAENFEEVIYETYGPGGTAIIIEGITDSKNRTSQEIKHLLAEHGATLAGQGAVTWAFTPPKVPHLGESETGWKPNNFLEIYDEATMQALVNLIDSLESHADIKRVSVNVELPENLV